MPFRKIAKYLLCRSSLSAAFADPFEATSDFYSPSRLDAFFCDRFETSQKSLRQKSAFLIRKGQGVVCESLDYS